MVNNETRNKSTAVEGNPGKGARLLSVVIPTLNEEDGLEEIVRRVESARASLSKEGVDGLEVIVVDDGSTDRTPEIAKALEGVRLIQHRQNQGYGAAIKTGFSRADGDILAFLDADGTYPPEMFPDLCRSLLQEGADVVVGSRRSGAVSQMPVLRRLGNLIWSTLVSLIGGRRCSDPASGMRVLRREALTRIYPLPDGLNFTPVMSTRCVHEDLKVLEVPIAYSERQGQSKLSIVHDGMRFLRTILWTALEYNPVRILGLVGVGFFGLAALIAVLTVLLRLQGVNQLGPWGVFGVFSALILSVSGVSLYSLGVTFNYLVALFHREPMRQGLLGGSPGRKSVEPHFVWVGPLAILLGTTGGVSSLVLGLNGWDITRLWFWLLASAVSTLVGLQLLVSWMVVRVLHELARREKMVSDELVSGDHLEAGKAEAILLKGRSEAIVQ